MKMLEHVQQCEKKVLIKMYTEKMIGYSCVILFPNMILKINFINPVSTMSHLYNTKSLLKFN